MLGAVQVDKLFVDVGFNIGGESVLAWRVDHSDL